MKRAITCILIIAQIFMLVGCSDENTLNKFNNAKIYSNFERTLENYYYEDNDSVALTIYSFSDEVSPIITIALQNLLNKNNVDIKNFSDEQNPYYFSILKSLYTKENNIDLKFLTDKSNEYDFFVAFNTAIILNDKECINKLKKIYLDNQIKSDSFSEKVYREINQKFITDKDGSLDGEINNYISSMAIDLKFDFNVIIDLEACLNYLSVFNVEFNKKDLQSVYNLLSNNSNQMFMLSQTDILVSQYMNCLTSINKLLKSDVDLVNTFYGSYEKENKLCYKGLNFEINSVRNLALYITGLYYSEDSDSEILYEQLIALTNQLGSNINKEDATTLFYYNYICKKLNINQLSISDSVDELIKENNIIESYYELKNRGETLDSKSLSGYDDLSKLLYLDVCNDQAFISENLKDIKIWDFKERREFPIMLNLYTAILLKNNLSTNDITQRIKDYIESKKNIYGYKGIADNYDLETSIYYTNIVNMVESGEDSELR